jgi:hypothetical protein
MPETAARVRADKRLRALSQEGVFRGRVVLKPEWLMPLDVSWRIEHGFLTSSRVNFIIFVIRSNDDLRHSRTSIIATTNPLAFDEKPGARS